MLISTGQLKSEKNPSKTTTSGHKNISSAQPGETRVEAGTRITRHPAKSRVFIQERRATLRMRWRESVVNTSTSSIPLSIGFGVWGMARWKRRKMDLVIWRATSRKAYGARFWNEEEAVLYMTYNCVMVQCVSKLLQRLHSTVVSPSLTPRPASLYIEINRNTNVPVPT